MSNLLLGLSGGVLGPITFKDLSFETWPLAIFLILLGSFGALFSAKHYEKFRFHMMAAAHYRNELEKLLPGTELRRLPLEAAADHQNGYRQPPKFSPHFFWTGLHIGIAALGMNLWVTVWVQGPDA